MSKNKMSQLTLLDQTNVTIVGFLPETIAAAAFAAQDGVVLP